MGIFASHGSRQCSDERPFRAASANLNDWRRGGAAQAEPDLQVTTEFHPLFMFPRLVILV